MTRHTSILFGVLAVLSVLLLAVACGSDPTATPPAAAPQAAASSASADPTEAAATAAAPQAQTGTSQTPAGSSAATQPPSPPAEKLEVVTTSNIVADWVQAVGGDRVDVFPLLPANADPHTYQPGARDIARIADADLVFSIGLELEGAWLEELIDNAARDHDSVVALGESVDTIDFVEVMDEHGHDEHGDEHATELMGRLLVGDGETGAMSVIDLEHNEVEQDAFDLGSRAVRLDTTSNGRFAVAVAMEANAAHIFDGGIYLMEHGDHFDLMEGPVERMDIDLFAQDNMRLQELVDAGYCPLVFPEGKLSRDGSLQPFQSGIGLMAARLEVPVVPVYLSGLFGVMSVHDRWPRQGRVRIEIGCPIVPDGGEQYGGIAKRVEESIREMRRKAL